MTEPLSALLLRKRARRTALAALPVGEKLRMLEEMVKAVRSLQIPVPQKPPNPVRNVRA